MSRSLEEKIRVLAELAGVYRRDPERPRDSFAVSIIVRHEGPGCKPVFDVAAAGWGSDSESLEVAVDETIAVLVERAREQARALNRFASQAEGESC